VIAQLKAGHAVNRGWVGIRSQPVTPAIAEALGLNEARGALVDHASGPAAHAGSVSGDVISCINAERIKGNFDASRRMRAPGTTVHVGVVRDAIYLGLTLASADALRGGNGADKNGVMIFAVKPDGRGADLGITPGDVILEVSGKPVQTPDGVQSALRDEYNAGRSATLMRVKAHDMTWFIAVPLHPM
jgi:serine protease Do